MLGFFPKLVRPQRRLALSRLLFGLACFVEQLPLASIEVRLELAVAGDGGLLVRVTGPRFSVHHE
jgi:hypothetical protein